MTKQLSPRTVQFRRIGNSIHLLMPADWAHEYGIETGTPRDGIPRGSWLHYQANK
jgi:hypothetical protein